MRSAYRGKGAYEGKHEIAPHVRETKDTQGYHPRINPGEAPYKIVLSGHQDNTF